MGTRWNRLGEAVLTSTHNLCFEQKYENIRIFIENFQFLVVKFSIYLNKLVFVMRSMTVPLLRIFFVGRCIADMPLCLLLVYSSSLFSRFSGKVLFHECDVFWVTPLICFY